MSSGPPLLETHQVGKTYPGGTQALAGVTLSVTSGETLVLIGESGCGKTTLLRLFNRMVEPTSGEVRLAGAAIASLDPIALRRRTGYVQQEGGLLPHWSVAGNIALVPSLLGWERRRKEKRVDELLDLVGLQPERFRDRYPNELSGGQRQRIAFARALAADPELVLLDEPFGAVDALTRLELHREFLRLKRSLGKTMILVTHDLEEAFRLGDRIAVLKEGRLLQCDSPQILRSHPAPGYVQLLIEQLSEVAV